MKKSWWEAGPFWVISLAGTHNPGPTIDSLSLGLNPAKKDSKCKISTPPKDPNPETEPTAKLAIAPTANQTTVVLTLNNKSRKNLLSSRPFHLLTNNVTDQQQARTPTIQPKWKRFRKSSLKLSKQRDKLTL